MKVCYEGIGLSGSSLYVFFTLGEVTAKRVHRLKVPLVDLTSHEVLHSINETVSKRLKAAWEAGEGDCPLF